MSVEMEAGATGAAPRAYQILLHLTSNFGKLGSFNPKKPGSIFETIKLSPDEGKALTYSSLQRRVSEVRNPALHTPHQRGRVCPPTRTF